MRSRTQLTLAAHVAGAVAAWGLFCLECGLLYAGLLVGLGVAPGGLPAVPYVILGVAAAGAVLTVVVLLPAVLISRAARRFSWPAALVLAAVLLALLAAAAVRTTDFVRTWLILSGAAATPLTLWCALVSLATRHPAEDPPPDDRWFPSPP